MAKAVKQKKENGTSGNQEPQHWVLSKTGDQVVTMIQYGAHGVLAKGSLIGEVEVDEEKGDEPQIYGTGQGKKRINEEKGKRKKKQLNIKSY